jgi:hypothetical protein
MRRRRAPAPNVGDGVPAMRPSSYRPATAAVRTADDPDRALLDFQQSTYEAAMVWRNGIALHPNVRSAALMWCGRSSSRGIGQQRQVEEAQVDRSSNKFKEIVTWRNMICTSM